MQKKPKYLLMWTQFYSFKFIQAIKLLACTLEVPGLDISWNTNSLVWNFSCFFLCPTVKCHDSVWFESARNTESFATFLSPGHCQVCTLNWTMTASFKSLLFHNSWSCSCSVLCSLELQLCWINHKWMIKVKLALWLRNMSRNLVVGLHTLLLSMY